jgi:hypothetical protein
MDVLVVGMILHDWDLNEKAQIAEKAHDILRSGAALIVL